MQPWRLEGGPLVEAVRSYSKRRQVPISSLVDPDRWNVLLRQARYDIGVPIDIAEDVCDTMGMHCRMLYGDDWDAAANSVPDSGIPACGNAAAHVGGHHCDWCCATVGCRANRRPAKLAS